MQKTILKQFWNNYADTMIRFDPFTTYKLGVVQAQTALKIDKYDVICALYQLSMKKAEVFVVMSRDELPLFRHYTQKLASLKLAFQPPGSSMPLKFVVWVAIEKLSAVKGKDNMIMVDVTYKNFPESLIQLLGTFQTTMKTLHHAFQKYSGQDILINNESASELKFNNYIECQLSGRTIESKLISLAVNMCIILVPGIDPNLKVGYEFTTKFYFQRYRFLVKGKIARLAKRNDGFLTVHYEYGFVPELVDIVVEYLAKRSSVEPAASTTAEA